MQLSKKEGKKERMKGWPARHFLSFSLSLFFSQKGQSMLEAIIASGIIVTAVTSSLTLVSAAIGAEKESEGGIIGAGLAREGIEVVRSIRDTNWLTDAPWARGLEGAPTTTTACPCSRRETNSWSMLFTLRISTHLKPRSVSLHHCRHPHGSRRFVVQAATRRPGPPRPATGVSSTCIRSAIST